ncbi:MAG: triose-phosphate isomerase [Acidobacteria bacterium]|nr:MAG: triose-phosphate isomerase [Acidobacteriota bacterium]REK01404.1 MAG: triose-phosphate isomerase [Acidobacteriota bacterium]REK14360.1 MAG: triose-phosphate isomerase [Acidobacteriota bacterium]REK45075.1 MAG: triose-phosphate isomerase [Acidobacteriota bacterium]
MRKPVIAGNWKMHKFVGDSVDTAVDLKRSVSGATHCEIIVAPVFTALKSVADRLEGSNVSVSAQDCSTEVDHGARTGEICADMIADSGAKYVIVGHSERRQFNGETDQSVNAKIRAVLQHGLRAIVCVGEDLRQRESGDAERVVAEQLAGGLAGLTLADMERIIIAYEPVWAIGTGKTATPEQAQEMHAFIRRRIAGSHSRECADSTRILYGGSVKPGNISDLMDREDIDGALVGGASLDAESFASIVNYK